MMITAKDEKIGDKIKFRTRARVRKNDVMEKMKKGCQELK